MPACPQCHAPLPDDAPEGLCPACLLKRGLENNTVPQETLPPIENTKSPWTPPSLQDLAPFFPDLDLLEFLGRGGMGAVYKARQKSLDRIVALKILPPAISQDPAGGGFAARFAQEAQAMARLNHPHIVTIYDFGQRDAPGLPGDQARVPTPSMPQSLSASVPPPLFFFLMEFVDGLTLRQLISSRTLAPKDALLIVPQICDALQYAHDRGIIHRDIKPENILLTRDGQIKIADFGLAKLIGKTATGEATGEGVSPLTSGVGPLTTTAGTPAYMAPEQSATPSSVDHRADIYALGVVFYQLLTGELPPNRGTLVPPSKKVHIDVRLDEIVLRALEKSPSLRYQNATQFKTEIETVLSAPFAPSVPAIPPASPPPPPPSATNAAPAAARTPAPVSTAAPRPRAFEHLRIAALLLGIAASLPLVFFLGVCLWIAFSPRQDIFRHKFELMAFIPVALFVAVNLFILISAIRMAQLRNYAMAVTSCILMFLTGNVLGLPGAIWAFILLLRPDIRNAFDRPSNTTTPAAATRRLSRTAIVGAIGSIVIFLALVALIRQNFINVIERDQFAYFTFLPRAPFLFEFAAIVHFCLYALGILSLVATPICGLIAAIRIRRSPTTLKGLPLALYDLLFVPLLTLDALIWLLLSLITSYIVSVQNIRADFGQGPQMAINPALVWLGTFVLSAILDTFIAWIAWLIARPPKTKPLPPDTLSPASPPSAPTPPAKPSTAHLSYKPPLLTAAAHVCLMALFVGFFAIVIPRQDAQFKQWHATLPLLTTWILSFSHLIEHWFCLLALPALFLVVGLPFAIHRLAGRILLLLYFILGSVAPLLVMLIAAFSMLLPLSSRAANSPAADLPYIRNLVIDALLAEGFATNDVILRLSPDGQSGSIDLPALGQLQGQTRSDGTTPVQGSLDLVRLQPGVWNVTGKGALSAFHLAVRTPQERGMGPIITFPPPPSPCAPLLDSARNSQPSDPARAAALLRQANVWLWLCSGDPQDGAVAQQLARELSITLPTGMPSAEDLEAAGVQPLPDDGILLRDMEVGQPVAFSYRLGAQLVVVSVYVTRNATTNSLVVCYRKRTEDSGVSRILPQGLPSPRPDGSWSVEFRDLDQRTSTTTRIAPGRFRIRVLPDRPELGPPGNMR